MSPSDLCMLLHPRRLAGTESRCFVTAALSMYSSGQHCGRCYAMDPSSWKRRDTLVRI